MIRMVKKDIFPLDEFTGFEREREFPEEQKTDFIILMERIENVSPKLIKAIAAYNKQPTKDNQETVSALSKVVDADIQELSPSFRTLEKLEPIYDKIVDKYDNAVNTLNDAKKVLKLDDEGLRKLVKDIRAGKTSLKGASKKFGMNHRALFTLIRMSYHSFRILDKLDKMSYPDTAEVIKKLRERKRLWNLYRDSKRKLVEGNVRFVINVAKNHMGRGLDFLDLIQEGNHALVKAVERFDPKKGFKLGTYAIWWIRQAMSRAIASQGKIMKLPPHKLREVSAYRRTVHELRQKLGRKPSLKEVAKSLEFSVDKVKALKKVDISQVSLDTPMGAEDDRKVGELISDETLPSPMQIVSKSILKQELKKILGDLSGKEERVIVLRFGLEDNYPRTLEEIGKIFNLSRERIRQIEMKALDKLRTPSRLKRLRPYLKESGQ